MVLCVLGFARIVFSEWLVKEDSITSRVFRNSSMFLLQC